jgi:peroxiredoxin
MKKILSSVLVITFIFLGFVSNALTASAPPKKGSVLPTITLPMPKDTADKNYLGLTGEGLFKISQVKAKAVVIEIFSMYCPYCQKEAANVNDLYNIIEKDQKLKGKIKIIGIGAGNTPYEVDIFKKTYNIPFPLFTDEDFTIHKAMGEVRTPYFIVININKDGSHKVIYSELGGIKKPKQFLDMIIKLSGLK